MRIFPDFGYLSPYSLYLAEVAKKEGYDPRRDFHSRIMFFSGEPGAGILTTKKLIEATYGCACIDYGVHS